MVALSLRQRWAPALGCFCPTEVCFCQTEGILMLSPDWARLELFFWNRSNTKDLTWWGKCHASLFPSDRTEKPNLHAEKLNTVLLSKWSLLKSHLPLMNDSFTCRLFKGHFCFLLSTRRKWMSYHIPNNHRQWGESRHSQHQWKR